MSKPGRPRRYKSDADRQKAYRRRLKLSVHFKSQTVEWATPQAFFDKLDEQFGFMLDVCAQAHNSKCERFYSPDDDGLIQPWTGVCWCNLPYGREIGLWVQKAYESALSGAATVVFLLPAWTDTAWWHRYVQRHAEVHFLQGRLKFGDSVDSAPFPSALVVFYPLATRQDAKKQALEAGTKTSKNFCGLFPVLRQALKYEL